MLYHESPDNEHLNHNHLPQVHLVRRLTNIGFPILAFIEHALLGLVPACVKSYPWPDSHGKEKKKNFNRVQKTVTMTTCSTIAALGMMPLNMWVYGQWLETGAVTIPYSKMSISLASVTAPVGAGMFVRWKYPNAAPYITKTGSYAGFAIIFICQTMELIIFPDIFDGIGWQFYVALVNIGTALTVISLSFPIEMQKKFLRSPGCILCPLITTVTVSCAFYQLYKRTCFKNSLGSCEKKLNGLGVAIPMPVVEKVVNGKPEEMQSFIPQEKLTTV
ncbi:hypothetical protein CEXT_403731 [Caerostris extrusa]|uniref:Uncharacterized protein n=1 Tax=Caerostris extrusa TaxID=172846 RepID=A0AAV4NF50_CAEEX|nr:hypothetical protein CEXT_403731 [Caerostris extrusa]